MYSAQGRLSSKLYLFQYNLQYRQHYLKKKNIHILLRHNNRTAQQTSTLKWKQKMSYDIFNIFFAKISYTMMNIQMYFRWSECVDKSAR